MFDAMSLWQDVRAASTPIRQIHVSDAGRFGFAHIDADEQGVEMGRPARLYVEVHSEGERICSVLVGGSAVIVGEGSLYEPDPA